MRRKPPGSNIEWQEWGRRDPFFGVASIPGKERGGAAPWTPAELFEDGRQDWVAFQARWERFGLDRDCCVEIGCGAGRVTMHLARVFRRVHAVDVSAGMIEAARRHVDAPGVEFHLGNGVELPLPDACATAVFSTHVFQHFDSLDVASANFAEVARVLRPGGTMMIHLPIHAWPAFGGVLDLAFAARRRAGDLWAWGRRLLLRAGVGRPIQRYLSYPDEYLFAELPRHGLGDVEITTFTPGANPIIHPFVLARKG
jgi:SAM-dependent methyltransferase